MTTCRELLKHANSLEEYDEAPESVAMVKFLASRVEKVLALPPPSERATGPESEHWYAKGYKAALRDALRLLNGEEP